MANTTYKNIDEYISSFSGDTHDILVKVRDIIKVAAPQATEGISYATPTFYDKGKYLVYSNFQKTMDF